MDEDYQFTKRKSPIFAFLREFGPPVLGMFVANVIFIASWMLSSLVRYFPKTWQKIYFGLDDMLILRIGEYREKSIPEAIDSILPVFSLHIGME